jgi:hypothetical protein
VYDKHFGGSLFSRTTLARISMASLISPAVKLPILVPGTCPFLGKIQDLCLNELGARKVFYQFGYFCFNGTVRHLDI